jgi:hypothetical protein
MLDAEHVSDLEMRTILQDCVQAIYWRGAISSIAGAGSAREVVRNADSPVYVVAGFWRRDKAIDAGTLSKTAGLSRTLENLFFRQRRSHFT